MLRLPVYVNTEQIAEIRITRLENLATVQDEYIYRYAIESDGKQVVEGTVSHLYSTGWRSLVTRVLLASAGQGEGYVGKEAE